MTSLTLEEYGRQMAEKEAKAIAEREARLAAMPHFTLKGTTVRCKPENIARYKLAIEKAKPAGKFKFGKTAGKRSYPYWDGKMSTAEYVRQYHQSQRQQSWEALRSQLRISFPCLTVRVLTRIRVSPTGTKKSKTTRRRPP